MWNHIALVVFAVFLAATLYKLRLDEVKESQSRGLKP
jgi:hypothetical protein